MAKYKITLDNGNAYTVEADENTNQSDIYNYVLSLDELQGKDLTASFDSAIDSQTEKQPERTVSGTAQDVAVTAGKGLLGLAETGVGLADLATKGAAGKYLDEHGYGLKAEQEKLDSYYSDAQKEANQNVENADGFVDTAKSMLENPSTIAKAAAESLPSMLVGGAVGRGLAATSKIAPYLAGAAGEAVVTSGQQAEGIRQQTDDGYLTPKQSALAVASGIGTGVIGAAAGKVAIKFGLSDIDTLAAGGDAASTNTSILKRVLGGAISEGVLEEMPQSAQEKMLENIALDKDPFEGVGTASATGLLTGGLMGGAGGLLHKGGTDTPNDTQPSETLDDNAQPEGTSPLGETIKANESANTAEKPRDNLADLNSIISGVIDQADHQKEVTKTIGNEITSAESVNDAIEKSDAIVNLTLQDATIHNTGTQAEQDIEKLAQDQQSRLLSFGAKQDDLDKKAQDEADHIAATDAIDNVLNDGGTVIDDVLVDAQGNKKRLTKERIKYAREKLKQLQQSRSEVAPNETITNETQERRSQNQINDVSTQATSQSEGITNELNQTDDYSNNGGITPLQQTSDSGLSNDAAAGKESVLKTNKYLEYSELNDIAKDALENNGTTNVNYLSQQAKDLETGLNVELENKTINQNDALTMREAIDYLKGRIEIAQTNKEAQTNDTPQDTNAAVSQPSSELSTATTGQENTAPVQSEVQAGNVTPFASYDEAVKAFVDSLPEKRRKTTLSVLNSDNETSTKAREYFSDRENKIGVSNINKDFAVFLGVATPVELVSGEQSSSQAKVEVQESNAPKKITTGVMTNPQVTKLAKSYLNSATPIKTKDGQTVRMVSLEDDAQNNGTIHVFDDSNNEIASMSYDKGRDYNGNKIAPNVYVDENWRRKGIATEMYRYAEKYGAAIPDVEDANSVRTEDGQAFRNGLQNKKTPVDTNLNERSALYSDAPILKKDGTPFQTKSAANLTINSKSRTDLSSDTHESVELKTGGFGIVAKSSVENTTQIEQPLTGADRIRANTEKRRQEQLQRDAEIGVEPIDRTPPEKTLESEHSVGDYYKGVSVADIEAQLPKMQKQADKLALQGASQMSSSGNRSTQKAVAGEGARKLYEQIQNLNGYVEARKNSVVKDSLTTENQQPTAQSSSDNVEVSRGTVEQPVEATESLESKIKSTNEKMLDLTKQLQNKEITQSQWSKKRAELQSEKDSLFAQLDNTGDANIQPVEKSPENKQVDDNVSKVDEKIDTSAQSEKESSETIETINDYIDRNKKGYTGNERFLDNKAAQSALLRHNLQDTHIVKQDGDRYIIEKKPDLPQTEKESAPEMQAAKDKAAEALRELGDIFLDANLFAPKAVPVKLDSARLLPVLSKLMSAYIEMGHITFKDNARTVLAVIREKFGDVAADSLTMANFRAAYNNTEQGATPEEEVILFKTFDMLEDDTVEAEPTVNTESNKTDSTVGNTVTIATPSNEKQFDVQYEVAEIGDVTASHDMNNRINDKFNDDKLQGRDRTHVDYEVKTQDQIKNFNPKFLGASVASDDGAPIITNSTSKVISGNGRHILLSRLYSRFPDKAAQYKQWLIDNAKQFGLSPDAIAKMDKPILVRRKSNDDDLELIADKSNVSGMAEMSALDRAFSDARQVSESVFLQFKGGELESFANQPFVQAFNDALNLGGSLTLTSLNRMKNAIMAHAYGDYGSAKGRAIVEGISEELKPDAKSILNALYDSSSEWVLLRAAFVATGTKDFTNHLVDAVHLIRDARANGKEVKDMVDQYDMETMSSTDPFTRQFVQLFFKDANMKTMIAQKDIAAILKDVATEMTKQISNRDMFDDAKPLTPQQILENAYARYKGAKSQPKGQVGIFDAGFSPFATRGDKRREAERREKDAGQGTDSTGVKDEGREVTPTYKNKSQARKHLQQVLKSKTEELVKSGELSIENDWVQATFSSNKELREFMFDEALKVEDSGFGFSTTRFGKNLAADSMRDMVFNDVFGFRAEGSVEYVNHLKTLAPIEGNTNVPSTNTDLERNSGVTDSANERNETPVFDGSTGDADLLGQSSEPVKSAENVANSDKLDSISIALTGGESSDNQLLDGNETNVVASSIARDSDSGRSGEDSINGMDVRRDGSNPIKELPAKSVKGLKPKQVKHVEADLENVKEAMPFLNEGQSDDVVFAEKRFEEHKGVLFANGTGTGKTFSGLGIVSRFANQGKNNILIVAPSQNILDSWTKAAKNFFDLEVSLLEDKNDAGKGIVATTYANFGDNVALVNREWDLIVTDEAHYLMSNSAGTNTASLEKLRGLTGHEQGFYGWFNSKHHELVNELEKLNEVARTSLNMRSGEAYDKEHHGKVRDEYFKLLEPAREEWKTKESKTKTVMLSATPFAYESNIDFANGYLFDYDKVDGSGYNAGGGKERFFMQHLGYRMRYNKLTQPDAKVDRSTMQRQFNEMLKKTGALSARSLDVPFDYDRQFILTESAIGQEIDRALQWLSDKKYDVLAEKINKYFDHLARRYLLEAIKAKEIVPLVKEHLAAGRKVLVFHDYKKGGTPNPFSFGTAFEADAVNEQYSEFKMNFPMLMGFQMTEILRLSPIERFQQEFGKDALIYNGDVSSKERIARVAQFNDDNSGKNLILLQSASAKEGVSFHDTTGVHQRVLINIGLPTAPTTAIQQEGRIYRVGQKSDAIFRYVNTGTNWERWAFAQTIAGRASAAENLALGEGARGLRDAFINAFENSDSYPVGHEGEGKGGKDSDKQAYRQITEMDRAKGFYYATQKKNSRTKSAEGTDYFATPEPVGMVMTRLADARAGEKMLEPSAGHGAIARWFRTDAERTAIEPSSELNSRLALVFQDGDIKRQTFEDLNIVNKYDAIVMNPPFGTGGKTAIEHLEKAFNHLRDGGRVVALIPEGAMADKRLDAWLNAANADVKPIAKTTSGDDIYVGDKITSFAWVGKGRSQKYTEIVVTVVSANNAKDGSLVNIMGTTKDGIETIVDWSDIRGVKPTGERPNTSNKQLVADISLPTATFERAGTKVKTHIVVIEKTAESIKTQKVDYSYIDDINELFDEIDDLTIQDRLKPVEESAQELNVKTDAKLAEEGNQTPVNKEVTYTTKKGKVLEGKLRPDFTKDKAMLIDKFTWLYKDSAGNKGWFIRKEHWDKLDNDSVIEDETPAISTPEKENFDNYVNISADSLASLRKIDLDRVLEQADNNERAKFARYITSERPDLFDEVDAIMKEDYGQEFWLNEKSSTAKSKGDNGFDMKTTYYHGTQNNIKEFKPSNQANGLIFFTTDPEYANTYAMEGGGYQSMTKAEAMADFEQFNEESNNSFDLKTGKVTSVANFSNAIFDSIWNYGGINEDDDFKALPVNEKIKAVENHYADLIGGGNIMPVRLKLGKTYPIRMGYKAAEKIGAQGFIDQGYDSVKIDEGNGKSSIAVVRSNQVRSVNAKFEDLQSDNILYSYAGQRAQNADQSALARAVQMEQEGIDNEIIRKETGWFLGMDDKWRLEISDDEVELKDNDEMITADIKTVSGHDDKFYVTLKLPELLKAKSLFDAYPELKEITVTLLNYQPPSNTAQGQFNSFTNDIMIPSSVRKAGIAKKTTSENNPFGITQEQADEINKEELSKGNLKLTAYSTGDLSIKSIVLHELQHAIQNIEGFARGGSVTSGAVYLAQDIKQKLDAINQEIADNTAKRTAELSDDERDKNIAKHKELVSERNALDDELDNLNKFEAPKYQAYQRLAGEIEARDTQSRMNLTDAQRKDSTPYVSQGISKEDALVRFVDGVANSETVDTHSKQSFMSKAKSSLDAKFGKGWFDRLWGTGSFEVISDAEALRIVGGDAKFHKAWHGSIHNHDKFDLSKIGTGEGEQAFGYGLYFADLRGVSEYYLGDEGAMFEVDLAPKQDEYIVYEGSLDKQSDFVKSKLAGTKLEEALEKNGSWENLWWDFNDAEADEMPIFGLSKNDYYERKEKLSKYLLSLGIRGIKYLDGSYKGEQNTSYVIFDDNDITIEAKYSKDGKIEAFYVPYKKGDPNSDKVYFVPENISKDTDLAYLFAHEIGVHMMQMGENQAGFDAILREVETLVKTGNEHAVKGRKDAENAGTKAEHLTEETLAYMIKHAPKLSIVQKFFAWFRKGLRAFGLTRFKGEAKTRWLSWETKLTSEDVSYLAYATLKRAPSEVVFKGDPNGGDGVKFSGDNKSLLAPNGKPSNLNAMQHAQVRTPEFKAWFGDFEQTYQSPVKIIELTGNEIQGLTPKEARENAKQFIDDLIANLIAETGTDTLHNTRTGFDIRLTKKGVVHGFQHQGAPTIKAIAGIKELLESAAKIATMPHEPVMPEWKQVHTFVVPLKINGELFVVKLTAKEKPNGEIRLYDHQALEMANPNGIYEPHSSNAVINAEKLGNRPASGLEVSIEQMLTAFKGENLKYIASKVVDENGEPLVVYHGTKADFSEFKGGVMMFSPSTKYSNMFASDYYGSMMPVFLNMRNPSFTENQSLLEGLPYWGADEEKQKGFDGAIYSKDGNILKGATGFGDDHPQYAVFEPNQIKSATGNNGDFDASNNDIRFSKSQDRRITETERLNTSKEIEKVLAKFDKGEITQDQLLTTLATLHGKLEYNKTERLLEKADKERVRGADFIRQKLLEAKRRGDISSESADLAEWFILKNEALVDDLGISIKGGDSENNDTAGHYNSLNQIITLIKGNANDTTAVHEILHHLERMMPDNLQNDIRKEWMRHVMDARKKATDENTIKYLDAVLAGNKVKAMETLKKLGNKQELYALSNASEFWAVNGADALMKRFKSKGGFMLRVANWLKEFSQHVKAKFGFASKSHIIKALDDLLSNKNPIKPTGKNMLSKGFIFADVSKSVTPSNGGNGGRGNNDNDDSDTTAKEGTVITGNHFEIPKETTGDKVRAAIQNDLLRLKTFVDAIKNQGGSVNDNNDFYQASSIAPNIAAASISDFKKRIVDPLFKRMADLGVTQDDVGLLAYAKHAQERNDAIQSINDRFKKNGGGSGMTNEQADEIIKGFKDEFGVKFRDLENLANDWQKITVATRDILEQSGDISPETAAQWRNTYDYYVPLKGFEEVDEDGSYRAGNGIGKGFSTTSKFSKRALGRESRAGQILENIERDLERAIIRATNLYVAKTLAQSIDDNPDSDLWEKNVTPIQPVMGKAKPQYHLYYNGSYVATRDTLRDARRFRDSETERTGQSKKEYTIKKVGGDAKVTSMVKPVDLNDEIVYFENGKQVRIRVYDKSFTTAFNRLADEGLFEAFKAMSAFNRMQRHVLTTLYPAFIIANGFMVDPATAFYANTGRNGFKFATKAFKNSWKAAKALYQYEIKGSANDPYWQDMIEQYRRTGGSTGVAYVASIDRKVDEFNKALARASDNPYDWKNNKLQSATNLLYRVVDNKFFNMVETLGTVSEQAQRLSTYAQAREEGLSQQKAAVLSQNVTVNFGKRGEYGREIGATWLFSNAGIQGIDNFVDVVTKGEHKKQAQALLVASVAMGFMIAMLNGDDGDDDLIPETEKQRYIQIPLGGGKRLDFKLPYANSFFFDIGRAVYRTMAGGNKEKIAGKLMSSFFTNFMPLGNPMPNGYLDAKDAMVAFSPQITKLFTMLATNRNAFGSDLMPESPFKEYQPDSEKAFRKTRGSLSDDFAKSINRLTGGDEAKEGLVSFSPESVKATISFLGGGFARTIFDTVDALYTGVKNPDELKVNQIPVVKNVIKSEGIDDYRRRMYSQVDDIDKLHDEFKTYEKSRNKDAITELKKESGKLLSLSSSANAIKKQIKDLREEQDIALKAGNTTRVKSLETKERIALINFNKKYQDASR